MHTEVQKPLGDVERVYVVALLTIGREDELVHAGAVVGQVVCVLQGAHDIVGVEHGALTHVAQPIRPVDANVGIGAHQHQEIAAAGAHAADRERAGVLPEVTVVALGWQRARQERQQVRRDADGAGAWAAAAMRCAACLVQIEVHDVESHVTWARDAHDGVGVGAIVIELAARVVHASGDLDDVFVEDPQRVRIGHHQRSDLALVRCQHLFEVMKVDATARV